MPLFSLTNRRSVLKPVPHIASNWSSLIVLKLLILGGYEQVIGVTSCLATCDYNLIIACHSHYDLTMVYLQCQVSISRNNNHIINYEVSYESTWVISVNCLNIG